MKNQHYLIIVTLLFQVIANAQWQLKVEKSGEKIEKLTWELDSKKVEALPTPYLKALKKTPTLIDSEEFDHKVLVIPQRSGKGLLFGKSIPLYPGEKANPALTSLNIPEYSETREGVKIYNMVIAPNGFYFTQEEGSRYKVIFFHMFSKERENPIEVLTIIDSAKIKSGVAQVLLNPYGVTVQRGNKVLTYRPNGVKISGRFIFNPLSKGNEDVLAGLSGIDLVEAVKNGTINTDYSSDEMMNEVTEVLFSKRQRNPLIWGRPGVNADGVVYHLAKQMANNEIEALIGWRIFQMDWSAFGTNGEVDVTVSKVRKMLNATRLKKVILYFPNVDQLIGLGVDGSSEVNDASATMLNDLKLGRVIVLGSTDQEGMGRMRASSAFYNTFRELEMPEPLGEALFQILDNSAQQKFKEHKVIFTKRILKRIIQMTDLHLPIEGQPEKSLQAISDLAQQYEPINPEMPDTRPVDITDKMFMRWLAKKARIPGLDPSPELKELLKPDNFHKLISKRFIGHTSAKEAIRKALFNVVGGSTSSNLPILFFTGPSGVGKTVAPEILAEILKEKIKLHWRLKTWDGQQFKDDSAVNILFGAPEGYIGHNKAGGPMYRWVKNNPQSMMLFDEFDKMHRSIHDSLYKLFDKGVVVDNSIQKEAYFTRGMVFLTSNFGSIPESKLKFPKDDDDTKDEGDDSDEIEFPTNPKANEYIDDWDRWHIFGVEPKRPEVKNWDEDTLRDKLLERLHTAGVLSPQMTGRIGKKNFIIFHHFTKDEIVKIGELFYGDLKKEMLETHSVKLNYTKELKKWILDYAWGDQGSNAFDTGARSIIKPIKEDVQQAVYEYLTLKDEENRTKEVTWKVDITDILDSDGKATGKKKVQVTKIDK